jgi:hypothetical protein
MRSLTRITERRTRKGQKEKTKVRLPHLTSSLKIKSMPFQMSLTMSPVKRGTLKMKNVKRSMKRSLQVLTGSSWISGNNFYFFNLISKILVEKILEIYKQFN